MRVLPLLVLLLSTQAGAQRKIATELWLTKNNISSKLYKSATEVQEYNTQGQLICTHNPLDVIWCSRLTYQYAPDGHLTQVSAYYDSSFRSFPGNPDKIKKVEYHDRLGRLKEEYHLGISGDTQHYTRYTCQPAGLLDTAYTFFRNKKYDIEMWIEAHFYNNENKLIKKVTGAFVNGKELYHQEYAYTYSLDSNLQTVEEHLVKRKGAKHVLKWRKVYNEKGLLTEEENIGSLGRYKQYTYQYNDRGEWTVKHVSSASSEAKIGGYYYGLREHSEYRRQWIE